MVAGMPDQPELALLEARPMINDWPTAYVCRHFVCKLPVTSVDELATQLQGTYADTQERLAASAWIAASSFNLRR